MKEGIRFSFLRLSGLLIQEWQGNFLHSCACVGHGVGNWTLREIQAFLLLLFNFGCCLCLQGRFIKSSTVNIGAIPTSLLVPLFCMLLLPDK